MLAHMRICVAEFSFFFLYAVWKGIVYSIVFLPVIVLFSGNAAVLIFFPLADAPWLSLLLFCFPFPKIRTWSKQELWWEWRSRSLVHPNTYQHCVFTYITRRTPSFFPLLFSNLFSLHFFFSSFCVSHIVGCCSTLFRMYFAFHRMCVSFSNLVKGSEGEKKRTLLLLLFGSDSHSYLLLAIVRSRFLVPLFSFVYFYAITSFSSYI